MTVTAFVDSYDTVSSMSHLRERESWPAGDEPKTIAYFCGTIPHERNPERHDSRPLERARRRARERALAYLSHDIGR
jgi:hypothetical protein